MKGNAKDFANSLVLKTFKKNLQENIFNVPSGPSNYGQFLAKIYFAGGPTVHNWQTTQYVLTFVMILPQINTGTTYKLQKVSDSQKSDMYWFVKKVFKYFYLARFSKDCL